MAKQIPERGSREMRIVNLIYFELCLRVAKIEFLFKLIILVDITGLLDSQVTSIHLSYSQDNSQGACNGRPMGGGVHRASYSEVLSSLK
jgi:hypothetical protein